MFAQTTSATLTGFVTDQSNAAMPGVIVGVINVDTGVHYSSVTNSVGSYTVPNLPPGNYEIEVQKRGFKTILRPDIVLHVQEAAAINFTMAVGSMNESVTVSGGVPMIDSAGGTVSTTIDRDFAENLPLNGLSFQSLILLAPGVTVAETGLNDYGQFSVNGQRASTNYFTVDGVSANIGMSSTQGPAAATALAGAYPGLTALGGTNGLVSVDAMQEFKTQTSSYSAEFGRQPGGQVSIVTRSGTNQFHGTLFDYLRNDALDARDYFNSAPAPKPALRQNDFGGTFSGPIFRDKTFFFFSYEGQRLRLPLSGTTYVPSLRVRQAAATAVGSLLNAFPNPTGAELQNAVGNPTGWSPYAYALSNPGTLDAYSIRIDHTLGSRLALFGRFNQSPSNTTTFSGGAFGTALVASTRTLTLGATSVLTPRLSNDLRFNYSSELGQERYLPATYGGAVPADSALLTSGLGGLGTAVFVFGGHRGAVWGGAQTANYQRQINIVDGVSLTQGAHQFKFGIDYRRLSPTYAIQDRQSVYFFSESELNSAIADEADIFSYDSARPLFTNFSAYAQDSWKHTARLTLDFGVRWELNPAPTEADGKMPAVALGITGSSSPDVSQATLAPPGTPFYKTFYTAFAPRFGAAYLLNSTGGCETVLRGGFGVYYDLGNAGASRGFPLYAINTLSAVPFPLSAADAVRPAVTIPTSLPTTDVVYSNQEDLKLPYDLQWSVTLEQSLGTQQAISLAYVASAARRLLTTQILNNPAGDYTGPRANPNFSNIYFTWNGPTSDYQSLQAQYKARLKRGLQALLNYTWSHAIDQVSTDIGSGFLSRGNADFDIRHNVSAALTYNLPSPNAVPVLKQVFGDWSVDAIVHAQSGFPIDLVSATTIVGGMTVYVRPDVVPGQPLYISDPTVPGGRRFNVNAFTAPPANPTYPNIPLQGNLGRNVLRGLPLAQADLALGRSFTLTEDLKLEFKGELFNAFNHPMFGGYDNFWYPGSTTFGVPTTTLRDDLTSSTYGGLSPLYQMGGPRSVQLSLRLTF